MKLNINKKDIIEYGIIGVFILVLIAMNFYLAKSIRDGIILNIIAVSLIAIDLGIRKLLKGSKLYLMMPLLIGPGLVILYVYLVRAITSESLNYMMFLGAYLGGNIDEIKSEIHGLENVKTPLILFGFIVIGGLASIFL